MQIGIGSSIVTKDDKFTFVLHQTTGDKLIIKKPLICPHWFDTEDEAKTAGSAALRNMRAGLRRAGMASKRTIGAEREKISKQFQQMYEELISNDDKTQDGE